MASVVTKVENKKICKHCKKKVVLSLDCVNCGTSFHRSCAFQAKVTNKSEKVICCKQEESEVRTENEATVEMDEKRLKSIFESLLNEYFTPIKKSIETEMMEFKRSVQYMSDAFEEQKTTTEEAIDEIKRLNEENVLLKTRLGILEVKVSAQEQKEKRNNLIVAGIPKQKEGNATKIIGTIMQEMGINTIENEIKDCYRINKQDAAPILVMFKSYESKIKIIEKVRELKGIKLNECGLEGGNKNIYFNEDLTTYNQKLFKMARECKIKNKYKSVYSLNGNIFMRKNETDSPIKIRSEKDIQ